ncbi:hypothetical protein [Halonatronum saccharophilum]|uniref:hypothetical protein n=1 Tax=Halonatronum saccharophilum TaxID=150060 RepID=UPI0004891DFC|nr:hypothetical protein [Halonatronum saccharophilum]
MAGLDLFLLVFVVYYTIKFLRHYYKFKKYGGEKLDSFSNKFGSNIFMIGFFVVFSLLNLSWSSNSSRIHPILFQLLLIAELIEHVGRVRIYSNGIFYGGKFITWSEIDIVRKLDSRVQIQIKNRWLGLIDFGKMKREKELLDLIESKLEKG